MGVKVQGWIADDPSGDGSSAFEPIMCTACKGLHLVNPSTGRRLGEDDGEKEAPASEG